MTSREHVVLIDKYGYRRYHHADGEPFLDPSRYEVTLITPASKADEPGPGEVRAVLTVDPTDTEALIAAVREVSAELPVDRLLAVSERHLIPAAQVRDALGLPGPSLRQMLPFRDKVVMKEHLRAHGILVPSFMPVRRPADAAPLLRRHGQILFKPRVAQGAVGVCVVSSHAELDALDAAGFSHPGPYEAEQFIAGEMFHVDTVAECGRPLLALASQYLDPSASYLVGEPRRSVNVDPGPLLDVLLEFNARLIAAYPWFSGATHAELFRDRHGRVVLCEIAGRPGGGGIIPAFKNSHQIDLCAAAILPQLDLPLPAIRPVADPDRARSGWVTLYADPGVLPGVLASIDGVPQADWVVAARNWKDLGKVVDPPAQNGDGVMVVTVCGPDATQVTARLDHVIGSVTARIESLPAPPRQVVTGGRGGRSIGSDLRKQLHALAAGYPDIYACIDSDRVTDQQTASTGDDFGPASIGGRGDSYIVAQQAISTRARGITQLVGLIKQSGQADSDIVVDLLGGDGLVGRVVSSLGPGQPVIVTCDASPFMVEAAWATGIPALLQRAEAPVFRTGSVGGVLLAYGTHHIPPDQRKAVICEAMRILAPGGALVIHDFLTGSPVDDWFTNVVDVYSSTGHDYVHFNHGEMESYLHSAGFTDIGTLWMDDPFVTRGPTRDQAEFALGGYLCDMYGLVHLNAEYGTQGAHRRAFELAVDTFRYDGSWHGSVRSDYDHGRGLWCTRMPRVALVGFGRKPRL